MSAYPYDLDLSRTTDAVPLQNVRAHFREQRRRRDQQREQWRRDLRSKEASERHPALEELLRRSQTSPQNDDPEVGTIVSVYHLSMVEQIRAERDVEGSGLESIPADAFVWALGEPELRYATKVGGMPYRPTDAVWPLIAEDDEPNEKWRKRVGEPMTFLAQFCFAGSRDIIPDLPGDVLLIFAEDEQFSRPEALHFEWQPMGIRDLVEAANVPDPDWQFVTCYGYRHRTCDYLSAECAPADSGRAGEHAYILGGTKIGGAPFFIQPPFERREQPESWPGRLLVQLSSICPGSDHEYPWVNRREPVHATKISGDDCLDLCDAGFLYVFLKDDGTLTWEFETH